MESMHTCLVAQSYPTLCDPWDSSPPYSSVHEILQARILEFPSPGDLLDPGIEPVSHVSPALQVDYDRVVYFRYIQLYLSIIPQ